MKHKILILGAGGMAGHIVYLYLKENINYEVVHTVFRDKLAEESIVLDITDKHSLKELINAHKPDIIINCVGVLIKGSKDNPDNAILVNSYIPHLLSRLAYDVNAKLIHISTDCVFSGKKGCYAESDFSDAQDIYGRSKALGEVINSGDLTIRTSIIGPELKKNGEGLFHWFMQQEGIIKGFTQAYWGGVTTLELAKAIDSTIKNNVTGLIHLTNGERISKYELLNLFKKTWNKKNIEIVPFADKKVDKSLKVSHIFKYTVPSYANMLSDLYEWMVRHKKLYKQYF